VPKLQKRDFSRKLTRAIEPKGGPGVELASLEDRACGEGAIVPAKRGHIGITRPSWY
jgi:hypothetical protein